MTEYDLPHLVCLRCGYGEDPQHPWIPRTHKRPKVCPKCKSLLWNKAKEEKKKE